MLEEEEQKVRSIAGQRVFEQEGKKVLTYEEYYNSDPAQEVALYIESGSGIGESRKDTDREDFMRSKASQNMFDNDLIDQAYKFWENEDDKRERLKKIWIDLKRKNALGGVD